MEHSSLDLSIVKKEPGFVEPFSSESGLFDNMMSDDFHDSNFHSLVSSVVYSWKDRSKVTPLDFSGSDENMFFFSDFFFVLTDSSLLITEPQQRRGTRGLAITIF